MDNQILDELNEIFYDENISSAVYLFFLYGLQPGSLTTCLLSKGSHCEEYAHPIVKRFIPQMVSNVSKLNDFWLGDKYYDWQGWDSLSQQERMEILKKINWVQSDSIEMKMIKDYDNNAV